MYNEIPYFNDLHLGGPTFQFELGEKVLHSHCCRWIHCLLSIYPVGHCFSDCLNWEGFHKVRKRWIVNFYSKFFQMRQFIAEYSRLVWSWTPFSICSSKKLLRMMHSWHLPHPQRRRQHRQQALHLHHHQRQLQLSSQDWKIPRWPLKFLTAFKIRLVILFATSSGKSFDYPSEKILSEIRLKLTFHS